MPSLWEKLKQTHDPAIQDAVADIAMLTPLSDLRIKEFYPEDEDKKKLAELLNELEAATAENDKVGLVAQRGARVLKLIRALGVGV
jgi:hypothetical protein